MSDAFHYFSSDLSLSATGDLLLASDTDETTQRVLRRLLTNLKDYLWQQLYGAGLPSYIGRPLDQAELATLIKAQMYLEVDVAHDPEPVITLQPIPNGIAVQITYTGVDSGQPVTLNFDVTP